MLLNIDMEAMLRRRRLIVFVKFADTIQKKKKYRIQMEHYIIKFKWKIIQCLYGLYNTN